MATDAIRPGAHPQQHHPAGLFLPASELKAVRRAAVEALLLARAGPPASAAGLAADTVLPSMLAAAAARPAGSAHDGDADTASSSGAGAAPVDEPLLRVLCRSPAQVAAALELPWVSEVILDFLEVHGLKEAAASVRAARRRLVVALPRILKPDEQRLWLFYLRLGADALLLRGAGALQQFMALGGPGAAVAGVEHAIPQLEGDFSLNAANVLAADTLLGAGLSRLALTHDLNASQICGLAEELGPRVGALEVVLHQHLAIFHTEHCVFCRFLSDGARAAPARSALARRLQQRCSLASSRCAPLDPPLTRQLTSLDITPRPPPETNAAAQVTRTRTAATRARSTMCGCATAAAPITSSLPTWAAATRCSTPRLRRGCPTRRTFSARGCGFFGWSWWTSPRRPSKPC
jgi:hypothetical protein